MNITIKSIAKKAGVSVSAVSKALNDRDDIGAELKERVKLIAKELGYKKNILASRLVTMKSNTLGVYVFSRRKIKFAESSAFKYIAILLDEATKRNYDILLFSNDTDFSQSGSYIDQCLERQVEGAIIIGLENDDPHIKEIEKSPFPIIVLEKKIFGKNVGYISTDNRLGILKGVSYLIEMEHKKISFIKGHDQAEVSGIRFQTYKKIMQEKGLYDPGLVFEGDYSMNSGYEIGKQIAFQAERPTAIFASNDLMALGIIQALAENDISVPRDISVMGYDDFEICKYFFPKLTTIRQDFNSIAVRSIELLMNMIENKSGPTEILIEPDLITRDSVIRNS